jgi:WD40 repeat protein
MDHKNNFNINSLLGLDKMYTDIDHNSPSYYKNIFNLLGCNYSPSKYLPRDVIYIIMDYILFQGKLHKTLKGHTDPISSLCSLPDGRVASGSWDKTIRIWNPHSGNCDLILQEHNSHSYSLCTLPDGRLVSGSGGEFIRVWNIGTGKCEMIFKGTSKSIYVLCSLPNGNIVSGGNGILQVWNIITEKCEKILRYDSEESSSTLLSLSNNRVMSGSRDGGIRIWNLISKNCEMILEGHIEEVNSLCLTSPNIIVSAAYDRTIRVWNLLSGKCLTTFELFTSLYSLCSLPYGRVAGGTQSAVIRILNIQTGKYEKTLGGSRGTTYVACALKDGSVVSSGDEFICVWK